jgi:hypothetical protein
MEACNALFLFSIAWQFGGADAHYRTILIDASARTCP